MTLSPPGVLRPRPSLFVPWVLIALSPIILVGLTSNPFDPGNPVQDFLRRHGTPILAIEMIVIGLALWAGVRPIAVLRNAPPWSWFALAFLLAIAFGVAPFAFNQALVWLHLSQWLVHLSFGLSLTGLAQLAPENIRTHFWPAVVAGLVAYAALLVLYVGLIPNDADFDWLRFGFGVTNIRHTGFFATAGISASLGLALTAKRLRPTLTASAAASILFALAFWAGSRGSILPSWVAVLFAVIWFKPLRSARSLTILSSCTVIGLLLSRLHQVPDKHFGLERLGRVFESGTLERFASGRLDVWRATEKAILDRPFFGHGQGQLNSLVREARPLEIYHPHNSVLQIAFDWGILGAACFAALLLYLCWHCLKLVGQNPGRELPAVLVSVALLTMSMHDGALYFTYPIFMLVVAVAWIAGTRGTLEANTRNPGR